MKHKHASKDEYYLSKIRTLRADNEKLRAALGSALDALSALDIENDSGQSHEMNLIREALKGGES